MTELVFSDLNLPASALKIKKAKIIIEKLYHEMTQPPWKSLHSNDFNDLILTSLSVIAKKLKLVNDSSPPSKSPIQASFNFRKWPI